MTLDTFPFQRAISQSFQGKHMFIFRYSWKLQSGKVELNDTMMKNAPGLTHLSSIKSFICTTQFVFMFR